MKNMTGTGLYRYSGFEFRGWAVFAAASSRGVTGLSVSLSPADVAEGYFLEGFFKRHGAVPERDDGGFKGLFSELERYFRGEPVEFKTSLDLRGTAFEVKVWRAIGRIPRGAHISYGQLAKRVGVPAGARAAGNACGRNPVPVVIPCHRVLKGGGGLGGYTGGVEIKKALLELEGHRDSRV